MERQPTVEEWTNTSLRTNIEMYFIARANYSRFHYSDIYSYAIAIIKYISPEKEENKKKKEELLKRLNEFYQAPLLFYYRETKKKPTIKERHMRIPFSRLEYMVNRYTAYGVIGRGMLGKHINLAGNDDITLGELIDLAEYFKGIIHENLTDFLIENQIGIEPINLPNFNAQFRPMGFSNAPRN